MGISAEEFKFVSDFIRAEAAIVLEPGKEYLVETRLGPVAFQQGMGTIHALIAELRTQPPSGFVRVK